MNSRKAAWSAALGAFGAAALLSAAPGASADPLIPVPPAPAVDAAAPLPPVAAPAPDQPAAPVSHLPSLDNLPPGATLAPAGPTQGPGVSYLRELWHAVQTQEVSKADAVLLLTQRPMSADTPPPVGVPAGPQAPLPVAPPAAPAPLPPAAPAA
ncbi:hypothetical protein [Mycolicibacterium mengxianglii]|uniref:hypothetical protein n=1 Tax=Mycolicibacterium mengxianglii TaxID=2736649 RepID=UPI0018D08EE2|nr:hypothetical protein [Mycolicibacterium mengxianglii]